MHKNTKLTPYFRKEIFKYWQKGKSIEWLADQFMVSRPTIYKVLKRGKIGDFSIHKSENMRYRRSLYGLKRIDKAQKIALGKLAKQAQRYEKNYPGEMVHVDTKTVAVRTKHQVDLARRECLFVLIDDYSRYLFADILPRKNKVNAAIFLETALKVVPFPFDRMYSDNGVEFKGNKDHDFVKVCCRKNIEQRFTRPGRPQTNGKAERIIRTIMEECLNKRHENPDERRKALMNYVRHYNETRPHSALKIGKNLYSPCQILKRFLNAKV
jgi:transposase InsO family protein